MIGKTSSDPHFTATKPGSDVFLGSFVIMLNSPGMRYDFPWSPNKFILFYGGAEYHDYHHYVGKSQSNFASVFTYCDYIYGTDKAYRYRKACIANMKSTWSAEGNANIFLESTEDLKFQ